MELPGKEFEELPGLNARNHVVTSSKTPDYNCIAWAAEDAANWWEPDYFWPKEAPKEYSTDAFVAAFSTLGYIICGLDTSLERGFQKVALFARRGDPTHMSRQLQDGRWTSKLGDLEDICHENLDILEGGFYGQLSVVMKRPNRV